MSQDDRRLEHLEYEIDALKAEAAGARETELRLIRDVIIRAIDVGILMPDRAAAFFAARDAAKTEHVILGEMVEKAAEKLSRSRDAVHVAETAFEAKRAEAEKLASGDLAVTAYDERIDKMARAKTVADRALSLAEKDHAETSRAFSASRSLSALAAAGYGTDRYDPAHFLVSLFDSVRSGLVGYRGKCDQLETATAESYDKKKRATSVDTEISLANADRAARVDELVETHCHAELKSLSRAISENEAVSEKWSQRSERMASLADAVKGFETWTNASATTLIADALSVRTPREIADYVHRRADENDQATLDLVARYKRFDGRDVRSLQASAEAEANGLRARTEAVERNRQTGDALAARNRHASSLEAASNANMAAATAGVVLTGGF
jgi:hypothetical protein